MMFTNYFIKKKIQSLSDEAIHRPHRSISLEEAHSLLVFYDEEDHEEVMKAIEPLRKMKKDVKTCVYVSGVSEELSFDETHIPILVKNDLNAWGFPKDNLVEKVKALKADILIDLTRPACYPAQYMALLHPCPFKVGIKYPEQEWYDLALAVTDKEDIAYLFGQILFYLRSIGAK